MKENKNLFPASILAVAIIIAALLYAYSQRYELVERTSKDEVMMVDKWKLELVWIRKSIKK